MDLLNYANGSAQRVSTIKNNRKKESLGLKTEKRFNTFEDQNVPKN